MVAQSQVRNESISKVHRILHAKESSESPALKGSHLKPMSTTKKHLQDSIRGNTFVVFLGNQYDQVPI